MAPQIRGQPPDERKRIRQEKSRPLLDRFEVWLRGRLLTLSPQSDTTKAVNTMLNPWQALVYYGRCRRDRQQHRGECATRMLPRSKNFFLGADSGGERAAAMYSLIGSARLNNIDPQGYLRYLLTHIADYP